MFDALVQLVFLLRQCEKEVWYDQAVKSAQTT